MKKALALQPDIVIMDLAMPGMDGVQATRRIAALELETKILILTVHDEDEFLLPALDAGAAGFLNKSVADTDLMGAIEALTHGHSYLPQRAPSLLARRRRRRVVGVQGPEVLSARELSVIRLYAKGFTARETAEKEFISPKTVEGYLARAKMKLGLNTRREIVNFALEAGLLRGEYEQ